MDTYLKEIRDHINKPRIWIGLFRDKQHYFQVCSALDTIEDCNLAIDAYLSDSKSLDAGHLYLHIYGLLQVLFVQQDAVHNLCEALKVEDMISRFPRLKEIREIRNDTVGHPTKRDRNTKQGSKKIFYCFISRISLRFEGFEYMIADPFGKAEFKQVSIPRLIADQRNYLSESLSLVWDELMSRDKEIKERFKMEKLASIFEQDFNYLLGKVYQGLQEVKYTTLGKANLDYLIKILNDFKEALDRRGTGIEAYPGVKEVYKKLEYPRQKLEEVFNCILEDRELKIDIEAALIFTWFIHAQMKELKEMAREIDEDYRI